MKFEVKIKLRKTKFCYNKTVCRIRINQKTVKKPYRATFKIKKIKLIFFLKTFFLIKTVL